MAEPPSVSLSSEDTERQRLQRLHSLRILHTPPSGAFDALARLAAAVAGTPGAMVNLVDSDRVWAKAAVGLPAGCDLPRASSLCGEVVASAAPLCVPDAQADARFAGHPAVAAGVRGYAGVPICLQDGMAVGTVCALDTRPRSFGEQAIAGLQDVASAAAELLEAWALTEQARRERTRLDVERTRLANIIEGTRAGTWEWNVQTGEVHVNERWAEMLGWRLQDLQPLSFGTWSGLLHTEDAAAAERALQRHFADPALDYDFEGRMRHRAGHWVWINYRGRVATWTPESRPEWMFGVHLDITQRKSAEAALRRTRQMLELVNEVARIGQWELDLVAGRLHWSRMTKEIHELGPDYEPDLASAIDFYAPGESREGIQRAVQQAIATDEPFDLELQIRTAQGTLRWVRAVGLVERQEGAAVRLHGSIQDIDDRVQAQERQRERERVEQAHLAHKQFIARMSHELRTPLNAMLGFTRLLLLDSGRLSEAGRRDYLGHVDVAGRHLLALVDDLLDLSRVEAGSLRLDLQPLDVAALVRSVASEMSGLAGARDVQIIPGPAEPHWVLADGTRLRQVLQNLISNAIAYNRPGGEVRVRVRLSPVPGGAGPDHGTETPRAVHVSVEDTGLGMSEQQLRSLYQPFNRLGRESGPVAGTGLGLTITRHLLQLMGSELAVDSVEGQGSRFSFTLPPAAAAAAAAPCAAGVAEDTLAAPTAPPLPAQGAAAGSVLYIDDDAVNRELMSAVMQLRPKVRLILAGSGSDGEALARDQAPDLALVDMMLPDMSGSELLQRIRRFADADTLPCVVVSANALGPDIEAARAAGFADYITKPIDLNAVLATVDRYLGVGVSA